MTEVTVQADLHWLVQPSCSNWQLKLLIRTFVCYEPHDNRSCVCVCVRAWVSVCVRACVSACPLGMWIYSLGWKKQKTWFWKKALSFSGVALKSFFAWKQSSWKGDNEGIFSLFCHFSLFLSDGFSFSFPNCWLNRENILVKSKTVGYDIRLHRDYLFKNIV